ncbi:hypothetical protein [Paenibacillus naphthalenovorans]|uniref:hypothetical protein n=1 Tax=Paenibacillus naphthalenovorans TaxID=162209 RepID=UPI003D26AC2D
MLPEIAVGFAVYGILVYTQRKVSPQKFIAAVNKMWDMRARKDGEFIVVEGQDTNYVRARIPVSDLSSPIRGTTLGNFRCYPPEEVIRGKRVLGEEGGDAS